MEKNVKQALNLDELLLEDAKKHLKEYAKLCDESGCDDYAEINCDLKWLAIMLVRLVYVYLGKQKCKKSTATTARIACIRERTVYNYVNKYKAV